MTDQETIGEWSDREDDPLPRGNCLMCARHWLECRCQPEETADGEL